MRLVEALFAGALLLGAGAGWGQAPPRTPSPRPPAKPAARPAGPSSATAAGGTLEANKAVVRHFLEDVLGAGRFETFGGLVAPDYVDSTAGTELKAKGLELVKQMRRRTGSSFKDVRYEVDQLIAEGDLVVARYTVHATHLPPVKRSITIVGITIFRLGDGRIHETWILNDQLEMLRQLGFQFSAPAGETGESREPGQPGPPGPAAPPAQPEASPPPSAPTDPAASQPPAPPPPGQPGRR